MDFTTPDMLPAAPEIFVLAMACTILIVDLFLSQAQRIFTYALAQFTLIGAAWFTLQGFGEPAALTFNEMFVDDSLSDVLKLAIYILVFGVFAYSRPFLQDRGMYRGEYFVLGLFGVVGMMIMVSASHFLSLYLGLELLSLSLYAMVALQRDSARATEAAMKYFVLGAIASGMLLYGMSLLYGMTGSLEIATVAQAVGGIAPDNVAMIFGLVLVVVGLAFKLGVVPFHMWIPDVYHGAPASVTLYIATAPKLAAFAMLMRLLVGGLQDLSTTWQDMLIIMAILSMGLGNIVAIAQSNLKRMLAYSTISHMGFFLLGLINTTPAGYSAAMFYMLVYALMGLGAFGMIVFLSRQGFEAERLEDMKGLNQRSRWYAFLMLLLMFSLAGVPPTAGFYAKLAVIQAVVDADLIWLAVVAVLFSVIGAFYYLRVVKLMYFDAPEDHTPVKGSAEVHALLGVNALALLFLFLTPAGAALMALCESAIKNAFLI